MKIDFADTFVGKLQEADIKLNSIQRQLVIWENYESDYGIWNYDTPNVSFALQRVKPKLQTFKQFGYDTAIRRYLLHDPYPSTGLKLTDMLDLPTPLVELIYDALSDKRAVGNKKAADIENNLERIKNKQ